MISGGRVTCKSGGFRRSQSDAHGRRWHRGGGGVGGSSSSGAPTPLQSLSLAGSRVLLAAPRSLIILSQADY
ncbi:hypothetical protein GWI33_020449 [Rhynchophorus ferrugineus]|uniref:Uncharacterized protein n=1 Tax=Rhynchophorus ferrugineus TaxID=354439 RepID=A0A834HPE0_RHYFE|nr:hypothetical protein GWI33_020449 [Rhynchophorus ferrugineus]